MRLVQRLLYWLGLHRLPFGPQVSYIDADAFDAVWRCRNCESEMRRREFRRHISSDSRKEKA